MIYYYFVMALQAFCIYHAIKNRNELYWVFIIFFIPLIGGLIYLFMHVINKKDVDKIQNELTHIINPTKRILNLEKQLAFADTFQNTVNLADGYFENHDFVKAIEYYERSLASNFKKDYYVVEQLVVSYYEMKDYAKVLINIKEIKSYSEFKKSKAQFVYGLTLEKQGEIEEAEIELRKVNKRYSNYSERTEFIRFLLRNDKKEAAKEILSELDSEFEYMDKKIKRGHVETITALNVLRKEL